MKKIKKQKLSISEIISKECLDDTFLFTSHYEEGLKIKKNERNSRYEIVRHVLMLLMWTAWLIWCTPDFITSLPEVMLEIQYNSLKIVLFIVLVLLFISVLLMILIHITGLIAHFTKTISFGFFILTDNPKHFIVDGKRPMTEDEHFNIVSPKIERLSYLDKLAYRGIYETIITSLDESEDHDFNLFFFISNWDYFILNIIKPDKKSISSFIKELLLSPISSTIYKLNGELQARYTTLAEETDAEIERLKRSEISNEFKEKCN